jgi:hypothetical protein
MASKFVLQKLTMKLPFTKVTPKHGMILSTIQGEGRAAVLLIN